MAHEKWNFREGLSTKGFRGSYNVQQYAKPAREGSRKPRGINFFFVFLFFYKLEDVYEIQYIESKIFYRALSVGFRGFDALEW